MLVPFSPAPHLLQLQLQRQHSVNLQRSEEEPQRLLSVDLCSANLHLDNQHLARPLLGVNPLLRQRLVNRQPLVSLPSRHLSLANLLNLKPHPYLGKPRPLRLPHQYSGNQLQHNQRQHLDSQRYRQHPYLGNLHKRSRHQLSVNPRNLQRHQPLAGLRSDNPLNPPPHLPSVNLRNRLRRLPLGSLP